MTIAHPFAALIGQQHLPAAHTGSSRVHRMEPETAAHREISSGQAKAPKETAEKPTQKPAPVPRYRNITERSLLLIDAMLDGGEHSLSDLCAAVGAPSEAALRAWMATATRLGIVERTRRAPRPAQQFTPGATPWLFRLRVRTEAK